MGSNKKTHRGKPPSPSAGGVSSGTKQLAGRKKGNLGNPKVLKEVEHVPLTNGNDSEDAFKGISNPMLDKVQGGITSSISIDNPLIEEWDEGEFVGDNDAPFVNKLGNDGLIFLENNVEILLEKQLIGDSSFLAPIVENVLGDSTILAPPVVVDFVLGDSTISAPTVENVLGDSSVKAPTEIFKGDSTVKAPSQNVLGDSFKAPTDFATDFAENSLNQFISVPPFAMGLKSPAEKEDFGEGKDNAEGYNFPSLEQAFNLPKPTSPKWVISHKNVSYLAYLKNRTTDLIRKLGKVKGQRKQSAQDLKDMNHQLETLFLGNWKLWQEDQFIHVCKWASELISKHKASSPPKENLVEPGKVQGNVWETRRLANPNPNLKNPYPHMGKGQGANERGKIRLSDFKPNIGNVSKEFTFELPQDVEESCVKEWSSVVVAYFVGVNKIPFHIIYSTLLSRWGERGLLSVMEGEKGLGLFFLMFKPDCKVDDICDEGFTHIQNQCLILKRWTLDMDLEKRPPPSIQMWVTFKNLKPYLITPRSLSFIASVIGKPICLDQVTEGKTRSTFAKVCIEITPQSVLPFDLHINLRNGDTCHVEVSYPWKPHSCTVCDTFDHAEMHCPLRKKEALEKGKEKETHEGATTSKASISPKKTMTEQEWQHVPLRTQKSKKETEPSTSRISPGKLKHVHPASPSDPSASKAADASANRNPEKQTGLQSALSVSDSSRRPSAIDTARTTPRLSQDTVHILNRFSAFSDKEQSHPLVPSGTGSVQNLSAQQITTALCSEMQKQPPDSENQGSSSGSSRTTSRTFLTSENLLEAHSPDQFNRNPFSKFYSSSPSHSESIEAESKRKNVIQGSIEAESKRKNVIQALSSDRELGDTCGNVSDHSREKARGKQRSSSR